MPRQENTWMCGRVGDFSKEETPVPIPNTAVKLLSPDDTVGVASWESRTLPLRPLMLSVFHLFFPS
jgi:hypothetical protein